jgi:hypothetical protein
VMRMTAIIRVVISLLSKRLTMPLRCLLPMLHAVTIPTLL